MDEIVTKASELVNQAHALCDEIIRLREIEKLYQAGLASWNPVYEQLLNEKEQLEEDALKWRTLLNCGRIRVIGSAGLRDPKSTYAHIGLEIWTTKIQGADSSESIADLEKFVAVARRLQE